VAVVVIAGVVMALFLLWLVELASISLYLRMRTGTLPGGRLVALPSTELHPLVLLLAIPDRGIVIPGAVGNVGVSLS
jgi:hypothetical protein